MSSPPEASTQNSPVNMESGQSRGGPTQPANRVLWLKKTFRILALASVTFGILVWRRPDQLLHPYIWVEEGTVTLPAFLHHGWLSIFYPVAGYMVLPSKLIFATAASLSFSHLPELTYWLAAAFTFMVVACVAYCPTYLRWPTVCAIAVLLIPTDAEVFAVSEYAFWWGTILVLVSVLWLPTAKKTSLRVALTALGGLSSPLIIPVTVLFLIRACVLRVKREFVILGTAVVVVSTQVACLFLTHNISHKSKILIDPLLLIEKFFGWFVFWSRHSHVGAWRGELIGGVVLCVLAGALLWNRNKLDAGILLLAACLAISIVATLVRVPLDIIHPVLAGPRYFFLPYILLAWLLIQAFCVCGWPGRSVLGILLVFSIHQTVMYGQRFQDTFDWQSEINACAAQTKPYNLPVQFDGSRASAWHVVLDGTQCKQLLSQSLF